MVDWIESSSDGSKKFEGKILLWIGQPLGPTGDPLRSTQSCCSSIRSLMTACPCVERSTVHPSAYKGFQPNTPHSPHHKNKKKQAPQTKKSVFCCFFVVVFSSGPSYLEELISPRQGLLFGNCGKDWDLRGREWQVTGDSGDSGCGWSLK